MSQIALSADVIVVGGGPAGTCAAIHLRRQGKDVLLLEKEAAVHHKVCGEFISYEATHYLQALGVDLDALGAQKIDVVRLVRGRRSVDAVLPFHAYSLSRAVMDEALLILAEREGVAVKRGVTVTGMEKDRAHWNVRWQDTQAHGTSVFLATGKHDVRGWGRPASAAGDYIAFKLYYALSSAQAAALSGAVEVILFKGGYAGLQLTDDAAANLCLVVRKSYFKRYGNNWENFLKVLINETPHLAKRLDGAIAAWSRPLAIYGIPYGFVFQADPNEGDDLFRLGDQMGVIPSFSGDGMAIAFHTGAMAASLYNQGSRAYHNRAAHDLLAPINFASRLMTMVSAPAMQMLLMAACRCYPSLLTRIAQKTRLPVMPELLTQQIK